MLCFEIFKQILLAMHEAVILPKDSHDAQPSGTCNFKEGIPSVKNFNLLQASGCPSLFRNVMVF